MEETEMNTWIRVPRQSDHDGNYYFGGALHLVRSIKDELPHEDIGTITVALRTAVAEHNGLGYKQEYQCNGQAVYCIDMLSKSMKENPRRTPEQVKAADYWLMLFPHDM